MVGVVFNKFLSGGVIQIQVVYIICIYVFGFQGVVLKFS